MFLFTFTSSAQELNLKILSDSCIDNIANPYSHRISTRLDSVVVKGEKTVIFLKWVDKCNPEGILLVKDNNIQVNNDSVYIRFTLKKSKMETFCLCEYPLILESDVKIDKRKIFINEKRMKIKIGEKYKGFEYVVERNKINNKVKSIIYFKNNIIRIKEVYNVKGQLIYEEIYSSIGSQIRTLSR